MSTEDIHKNTDVFPTTRGGRKLDKVAADMLEDVVGVDWLEFSFHRRVGLGGDIALSTFGDETFDVGIKSRPACMPKQGGGESPETGVAGEFPPMGFFENAVD